jgi:hypothetical protein
MKIQFYNKQYFFFQSSSIAYNDKIHVNISTLIQKLGTIFKTIDCHDSKGVNDPLDLKDFNHSLGLKHFEFWEPAPIFFILKSYTIPMETCNETCKI